jgi:peptide-methionine (R)-S-oxide reductase
MTTRNNKTNNRRKFLSKLAITTDFGVGAIALSSKQGLAMFGFGNKKEETNKNKSFPYQLTDEQWREKLSPKAYDVLRKHATERAGTSPLDHEKRNGVFHCAGCDHPLFASGAKFDSGTGWPSFYEPLNDEAIGTTTDYVLFYPRTEVHCANCGGHQGHVFEDGPKPTGLRYCINGVAMAFKPS